VDDRPIFFYDFNSPYAWLAAERVNAVLPVPPVWQPVSFGHILQATGRTPWSLASDDSRAAGVAEIERRAAERGLPAPRWVDGWPRGTYSLLPLRAAVFAQQAGRAVSFSLAAFRQFFAAGRTLAELDNVLIAAAASELHPRAVTKGIESKTVKDALREATDAALARGVIGVPTVAVGDQLFWGDDRLEDAAAELS
jgi:2-hydroxychromene-2-carboxylate isomerase